MTYAQITVQSGMTADSHCGNMYCITAVYSPQAQSINYTLVHLGSDGSSSSDIGWWGIAQGTEMKGANMAINWVNDDGSKTTSHRSATGESYPKEDLASSLAPLTVNDGLQSTSSKGATVWSWNFKQTSKPSKSMQHIFAKSSKSPSSSSTSASLPMHDDYEYPISLDLTKAYDGSAPAGLSGSSSATGGSTSTQALNGGNMWASSASKSSSSSNGMRDLSKKPVRLFLVHMIFMVLTWMLIVPVGILIARYGRSLFTWFPSHRGIQIVGAIFVVVGAACAFAAVDSVGRDHFQSSHAKSGIGLLVVQGQQILLGGLAHWYKAKTNRRWIGYLHMPLGIILMAWSIYTIHLGFEIWHWNPPNGARYFIYGWSGFLALAYFAGFALLPRELKQQGGKSVSA